MPFEYGAVCLSDCFMYLCKKIRFVSQRIFVSAQFFCTTAVLLWGTHWGAVSWIRGGVRDGTSGTGVRSLSPRFQPAAGEKFFEERILRKF